MWFSFVKKFAVEPVVSLDKAPEILLCEDKCRGIPIDICGFCEVTTTCQTFEKTGDQK